MARILNKAVGKVVKKYNNITRDSSGILTGPINKLWRGMILLNRVTTPLPKDTAKKGKAFNPNGALGENQISSRNPVLNNQLHEKWRMELQFEKGQDTNVDITTDPAKGHVWSENQKNLMADQNKVKEFNNQIIIVNFEANPIQSIVLQNRPMSLDFRGETTWATIKSMGRNTPMYHYVGSEDIIQFNISWYCNDKDNPQEVLAKCRLLESWTKSNGYQASPPVLKIDWGSSGLFENHLYILTSATYTLSNFKNGSRQRKPGATSVITDGLLLPSTATQELIFKRVSAYNLGNQDVIKPEILKKTKDIDY